MNETENEIEGEPPNLADRANALAVFEKIEKAIRLIDEAIKERPSLKVLQVEPLLRSLADGLRILSTKNSELDLQGLMLKQGWRVGQRFYVRVVARVGSECSFVVLPAQDIPEGVVIIVKTRKLQLADGEPVALDLEIKRGAKRTSWHIRAIDRE